MTEKRELIEGTSIVRYGDILTVVTTIYSNDCLLKDNKGNIYTAFFHQLNSVQLSEILHYKHNEDVYENSNFYYFIHGDIAGIGANVNGAELRVPEYFSVHIIQLLYKLNIGQELRITLS